MIHDLPLDESLMTDEKCAEFFQHFKHTVLDATATQADRHSIALRPITRPLEPL
ncbi:MAG: hypothetical protein ACM65K_18145 [Microcoleus sp.]